MTLEFESLADNSNISKSFSISLNCVCRLTLVGPVTKPSESVEEISQLTSSISSNCQLLVIVQFIKQYPSKHETFDFKSLTETLLDPLIMVNWWFEYKSFTSIINSVLVEPESTEAASVILSNP